MFIADAGRKRLPCDSKSDLAAIWKLGYLILTIIDGQAQMHIVCRKSKSNAFGDFAYDFTEATSRIIESRKDVCSDRYQNHFMKGATKGYPEA